MTKKKVQPKKKIVSTSTYTFIVQKFDDGTAHMKRLNNGFNVFELIGLAELISSEVIDQINNKIKREVLVD